MLKRLNRRKSSLHRVPNCFLPVVKCMFFWMRWIAKGGDEATPSRIDSVDKPIEPAELETLFINRRGSGGKVAGKDIR
jgi:hypothetical protein